MLYKLLIPTNVTCSELRTTSETGIYLDRCNINRFYANYLHTFVLTIFHSSYGLFPQDNAAPHHVILNWFQDYWLPDISVLARSHPIEHVWKRLHVSSLQPHSTNTFYGQHCYVPEEILIERQQHLVDFIYVSNFEALHWEVS